MSENRMTREQWDRLWASIPAKRKPHNDDWYLKRRAAASTKSAEVGE